jgi:hypothetical protein
MDGYQHAAAREDSVSDTKHGIQRSLRALEWLNFFLADVQTGLGPCLAAYLASNGWNPDRQCFHRVACSLCQLYRAIFVVAALLAVPAAASLFVADARQIDYARARGCNRKQGHANAPAEGLSSLLKDRVLLYFLACVFLFHLANAAMCHNLERCYRRTIQKRLSRSCPRAFSSRNWS